MDRIEAGDTDVSIERLQSVFDDTSIERLQSVFDDTSVRVAILFGSAATGRTHTRSDIDLAVEFEDLRPGDSEYNKTYFDLQAALDEALGTDEFDLVDMHSLTPSLARSVFDDGILVVGTTDRVKELRESLITGEESGQSPRERFDDALRRIDEHLA